MSSVGKTRQREAADKWQRHLSLGPFPPACHRGEGNKGIRDHAQTRAEVARSDATISKLQHYRLNY